MNSIVRNFIFVISRFKMASFLNVGGLSVAFTAFLILFMQIRYEWGYDRFHKHADRLYRLEIVFNNTGAQVVLNRPLIDRFLASSPHIEEGALINQWATRYISRWIGTVRADDFPREVLRMLPLLCSCF